MSTVRDAVGRAGAKVARCKLNLLMAEAELSKATQAAIDEPRLVRPPARPVSYGVKLVMYGQNKIQMIKTVRMFTNLGLKEAKDLVDSCVPFGFQPMILDNITKERAEEIKREVEAAGGRAEIVKHR